MMLAFISGIGGGELLIIFIIFLMLFGSKKLPGIARNLGKTMADLQRAAREVREEFLNADRELNAPSSPPPLPHDNSNSSGYGEWHPDMEGDSGEGGPVSPSGEGGMPAAEAAASEPAAMPSPVAADASGPVAPMAGEEGGTAASEDLSASAGGDTHAGGGATPVAGADGTGDDGANRKV